MKRYGKEYGKGLDENTVLEAFKIFLNADTKLFRPLVSKFLTNLQSIQKWAHLQRKFNLYSSSVLLVYDAKRLKEFVCTKEKLMKQFDSSTTTLDDFISPQANRFECMQDWIKVKMIDFAHIFPNETGLPDTNYTHGIDHLVRIFEQILQET